MTRTSMKYYFILFLPLIFLMESCKEEQILPDTLYTLSEQPASFDWNSLQIGETAKLAIQVNGKIYLFEDKVNTVKFRSRREGDVSPEPKTAEFRNRYSADFRFRPTTAGGEVSLFTIWSPSLLYIGSIPRVSRFHEKLVVGDYLVLDNGDFDKDGDSDVLRAEKDSIRQRSFEIIWNEDVINDKEWKSTVGNYNGAGKSFFKITNIEVPDSDEFYVKVRCEFEATFGNVSSFTDTLRIEKGVFVGYFENPFDRLR